MHIVDDFGNEIRFEDLPNQQAYAQMGFEFSDQPNLVCFADKSLRLIGLI